ncbi:D-isomer specific 2-hydroxyacid dehydrogenase family protein [Enteractinococcus fodinae]|uniref:Phosphoglycerate dehydrogenase-like enzyme n=1 Tax=Enteractinococcus fodinae TaxID=684663 RepID=A0ABU2B211_9MICC|nr:NAD(P)-dependent oxidoreductase [Enteractinococcus fodinae]MDR7347647.1 phosphoglycerate dehydrogenase-like enzyme [Enteractinococcus fodinae]
MTQRIVILPVQSERDGTPYETAHEQTVATAESLGYSIVDPDDGNATAIVVVQMLDSAVVEQTLANNPDVTWVQLPFAGVETFLPVARKYPNVTFTSAKGSYAPPVAEHALALTLALLRHLPERIRATTWGASYGTTLNGANVVIVGGGGIGQELVRLFSTWNTTITVVRRSTKTVPGADRTVTAEQLDSVLPEADVVVLAAAATPETDRMFTAKQFELMHDQAVLVNIARGSLVDTDDLVAALADHKFRGVGLDVTDPEPLPDGHPLWAEPNCIITPHTADTPEMVIPLLDERIVRNLKSLADGKSPDTLEGLVDVQAGY